MKLMEYISVKDMTKIYNDLNEMKRAETIWKELKTKLQTMQLDELKQEQDAEMSKEEAKAKRKRIKKLEAQIREEEEKEKALEEERKRKKEERRLKRERREKERQEAEEAAAAAEAEAAEQQEDEDPAEAKARRKAARRKAKEEALAAEEQRAAEEAAEQEEEQRLLAEKKARKEERRRRREEAAELQEETQRLEQQAQEVQKKREEKANRNLKKEWLDHVKDHPLEFGDDNEEKLVQVSLNHKTKPPPKEFLKVKRVKITSVEDSEEAAFYNCEFIMHVGKPKVSKKRYSQFLNLKTQLGATIIEVDAPFPGKTFMKVKGSGLEKRKQELELWVNQVIEKLATTRSYADVQLKQQLRGDAARAEAERQRMQKAAVARQCLHEFCEVGETDSP
eukprot:TRINITY_DN323_c5_g1_i1.p1 TRINITY_DN323_c5_g1~~TRINITY_DN323_c5_g1_i1.p1  ORF type:complete len:441 (+),score=161.43 TRINITY_DN323_c5_g1_i1:147-1325(+)